MKYLSKLIQIDDEIKLVSDHKKKAKKMHNLQSIGEYLDRLDHIIKGLQKAKQILED